MHQHPRLARAGTGKDQLTTQRRGYSLALGIVEGVQEKREIVMHGAILAETRLEPRVQRTDVTGVAAVRASRRPAQGGRVRARLQAPGIVSVYTLCMPF